VSVVAGAAIVVSVVAGAATGSVTGATVVVVSSAGAVVSLLPPQEAINRPIDRATMLSFTNFMFVIFKSYLPFIP
jgi:hypothetical protein